MPGLSVIERYELAHASSEDELVRGLDGTWATVAGSERYTPGVLQATRALKAIFRFGTGSDAIDIAAATDAGVAVFTTPAVNAEAVADMALVLMLACIRRLPVLDKAVRTGEWRADGPSRAGCVDSIAMCSRSSRTLMSSSARNTRSSSPTFLGCSPE